MSSFLEQWLRKRKSGSFHRKWQSEKKFKTPDQKSELTQCVQTNYKSSLKEKQRVVKEQFCFNEHHIDVEDENNDSSNWSLIELNDDSDNEDNVDLRNQKFIMEIRKWALEYNIKQNSLKSLITVVNKRLPDLLPKDPRTLLRTPANVSVVFQVGDGQYWHYGLKSCLKEVLFSEDKLKSVSLNINMDGLPIYNSSKDEFWPILFNINEIPELKPMVIGVYWGKGKPNDINAFLQHFVEELTELLQIGIQINNRQFEIKVRCFICDSPARSLIKGVANFNSQNGCQKCTIIGEYSYESHCNYYPRRVCEKRTDSGFRNKAYGDHHKIETPLLKLPDVDMIEDFPIADSLHLLDLGIMKRLLIGWRDGSFSNYKTKWRARDSEEVSRLLFLCKMPREIHRAVRGLNVLAHWKGLEYRTFLYYISIVILKYFLPFDAYEHFLLFFCAVTICSSRMYVNFLDIAEVLFTTFVEIYGDIYGEGHITSNVHNLTHIVDEVRRFGILASFNSYPFESKLYQIKNTIRSGNRPLAQIAKRLSELSQLGIVTPCRATNDMKYPILQKPIENNQYISESHFATVLFPHFSLSTRDNDKWFLTNKNEIVCVKYVLNRNGIILINGCSLKNIADFFVKPIRSSYLNIYSSTCNENSPKEYSLNEIKCKLVAVKDHNNSDTIFIPLLHTL